MKIFKMSFHIVLSYTYFDMYKGCNYTESVLLSEVFPLFET